MKVLAVAKVNLALRVGARRIDGFHELVTIFQSVGLADVLEVETGETLALEVEGDAPPGEDNLVLVAARALARAGGIQPAARLRLEKRIPAAAGLGGGSSDAAAALLALDRLWRLRAPLEDLRRLAAGIGSDVPYFLLGGTALGLGRGADLFAIAELPRRSVVLALPGIAVSTAEAFAAYDLRPRPERPGFEGWRLADLWSWNTGAMAGLGNDLEEPVFAAHPSLAGLRRALVAGGAEHALLSGSGSTVFGVFTDPARAAAAAASLRAGGCAAEVTETLDRATLSSRRFPEVAAPDSPGRRGFASGIENDSIREPPMQPPEDRG